MTGPASSTQVLGMARKSSKGQAVPTMHVVGDSTCAINGLLPSVGTLYHADPCAKGLNIGGPTRKAIRVGVLWTALIRLACRWLVYVKAISDRYWLIVSRSIHASLPNAAHQQ